MASQSGGSDCIVLAHGGGGELTERLIREHFLNKLGNATLNPLTDGAILGSVAGNVVMTTDSFVVHPLEFPGGDIGRLAVCGTVNDLAMMGAKPLGLSLGVIMEEGLPLDLLDRVVASLAAAAEQAGVKIVTGDTKVIERRGADGLFINTAGVGVQSPGVRLGTDRITPGDRVLISGRIAEHGLAVLSKRNGLEFASSIISDVAPLSSLVDAIVTAGVDLKFLRDPTRGGLAGVVADVSKDANLTIEIEDSCVPITATSKHASEMLGLDPLTIANEGKLVAIVAEDQAKKLLDVCRSHPLGRHAAIIGKITDAKPALAELVMETGGRRVIQKPYGEEVPRIC